jgi:hypothetical protein
MVHQVMIRLASTELSEGLVVTEFVVFVDIELTWTAP